MATHSSILAWEISWKRSLATTVHGVARVEHECLETNQQQQEFWSSVFADSSSQRKHTHTHTHTHTRTHANQKGWGQINSHWSQTGKWNWAHRKLESLPPVPRKHTESYGSVWRQRQGGASTRTSEGTPLHKTTRSPAGGIERSN